MTNKFTLYHNPRCSKSRQTLKLLQENGFEPEIILYLETQPTIEELRKLVKMLGIPPRGLLRKGEEAYKTLKLSDPNLDDETLLGAMATESRLIERPIAIRGKQAVLGRPPENVLRLF